MNLTKAMADLFIQVKEWAQPALNELAARVDDREAAIRKDLETQIAELRVQIAEVKGYKVPEVDVEAIAKQAAALIPAPEKGDKGDSVTIEQIMPLIDKAVAALPPAQPGKDADPIPLETVQNMVKEAVSQIPKAENGKDGTGMAGCMIDRDGCLIVTLTNGETKNLGVVVGKDGDDGMSLESFDLEYIEETHEINVKASCAGRVKEIRYPAGGIRPAGYWREGTKSKAGDAYVHDGSLWVARKDTTSKPANPSEDWVLAARKGRDAEPQPKKGPEGTVPLK